MSKSQYVLFTGAFWGDTAERVVSTAAQSVLAVYAADQVFPSAFTLDYKVLAGVAAGGALGALMKVFAKLGATAPVATVEVPRVPTDDEIRKHLEGLEGA